jgi:hypothetical protein
MRRLMALTLIAMSAACASGGGSNSPGVINNTRGMGNATAIETYEITSRILTMHQFEVEHEAGPPTIYFQTRWRERHPFEDEVRMGIDGARIRATVRARARSQTSLMGEFYNVDLAIEQQVRFNDSNAWEIRPATASAVAYAEEIAQDMRRALDVGVRRH